MTARDRTRCAYCGEPATTYDHVPPQCLYTRPLPSNLVTVPACAACNNGASKDDAEFRNHLSIMAGSFREFCQRCRAPSAKLAGYPS